ncbi:MAG: hypothetical protein V4437_00220, partial [Patescibacteria group bacterium]
TKERPRRNAKLDMAFSKDDPEFSVLDKLLQEKRYLVGIAEVDDVLKVSGGDRSASVYGMQTYNVASLIEWYARATSRMADRIDRGNKKKKKVSTEHKIMMGTHGGVAESFLAEVIRYTMSDAERERFLHFIPNGFGFVEGADIDIVGVSGNQEPTIRIRFTLGSGEAYSYDKKVPVAVIYKIVGDFSPKQSLKSSKSPQ